MKIKSAKLFSKLTLFFILEGPQFLSPPSRIHWTWPTLKGKLELLWNDFLDWALLTLGFKTQKQKECSGLLLGVFKRKFKRKERGRTVGHSALGLLGLSDTLQEPSAIYKEFPILSQNCKPEPGYRNPQAQVNFTLRWVTVKRSPEHTLSFCSLILCY